MHTVILVCAVLIATLALVPASAPALGLLTACETYFASGGANSIAGMLCAFYLDSEYHWSTPW